MVSIKDITEFGKYTKLLLNWSILAPFWYIGLLLFHNSFFINNSIITIILFSVVFSVINNMIIDVSYDLVYRLKDPNRLKNKPVLLVSLVYNSLWLSFIIVCFYTLRFFFKVRLHFFYFIVINYIPLILLFFYCYIRKRKYEHNFYKNYNVNNEE
jgi:hypothetical protein